MPACEPALAVDKIYLRCDRLRNRFARYLFLNTRSKDVPQIGTNGQGRYAALHVPEHVAHVMKSAPTLSVNGS